MASCEATVLPGQWLERYFGIVLVDICVHIRPSDAL